MCWSSVSHHLPALNVPCAIITRSGEVMRAEMKSYDPELWKSSNGSFVIPVWWQSISFVLNAAQQAGVTDPLPAVEDGKDSEIAGG